MRCIGILGCLGQYLGSSPNLILSLSVGGKGIGPLYLRCHRSILPLN